MLNSVLLWTCMIAGSLLLSLSGARRIGKFVIGGRDSEDNAWPWHAMIRRFDNTELIGWCGGSIISRNWVLSVAHCYTFQNGTRRNVAEFVVIVGTQNNTNVTEQPGAQVIATEKIIVPDAYNNAHEGFDVALLKLSKDIVFGRRVQSIRLAQSEVKEGTMCVVLGFGRYTLTPNELPNALQEAYLPIVGRPKCAVQRGFIRDNNICAGVPKGDKTTCNGDSGGPLACNVTGEWELQGLTSYGILGCVNSTKPWPSVYASVPYHQYWIEHVMEENRDTPATEKPNVPLISIKEAEQCFRQCLTGL